jgi:hypothetical protein
MFYKCVWLNWPVSFHSRLFDLQRVCNNVHIFKVKQPLKEHTSVIYILNVKRVG